MPNNPDPILAINALSAVIGRQGVLQDVNLTVAKGDWLGIVGGSGAGKTTLLRIIMGLRKPARPVSGSMSLAGQHYDFTQPSTERTKGIAFVPQSPAHGLDPLRPMVWQWNQLLRIKAAAGGLTADQRELFDALGLPEPDKKFPHEWSRGMQQRFLLAMALMESPEVVILDEPTSALDAMIAAQVLKEVQRIVKDRGVTVMMVTHDIALATSFATSLAILMSGTIVEQGATDAIIANPKHDYTKDLVSHRRWRRAPVTGWVRLC